MNRLTLRDWSKLDDIRQKMSSEAEMGRWQLIPNLIFESVLLCGAEIEDPSWNEVAELYVEAIKVNQPRIKFPIFNSKEKGKNKPWEYQGRTWYFWLNTLASRYGWSAEQIGELDLDDAIGVYQEIILDEQFEKEWEWGLSERAFVYNKSSKTSSFKPLGRPDWMSMYDPSEPQPVKKIRIPVKAMPVGVIISLDGT